MRKRPEIGTLFLYQLDATPYFYINWTQPRKINEMSCIVPPGRRGGRLFAQAQGVLSVATLITILAVIPVHAQRAGSSARSRLHSPAAFAASNRALAASEESTRRVIRLMDKDKNGVVSKEEFLQFMSKEFDRLDVNRNEQLERREMMHAMCRGGRGPLFCDLFRR